MSIASPSPRTDAASRLGSGRGRDSDTNSSGFLDALSNSGGQGSASADDSDAPAAQSAAKNDDTQAAAGTPQATDDSAAASQTQTDATMADAMATLGVNAGKAAALVSSLGGTPVPPALGKPGAKAAQLPDTPQQPVVTDTTTSEVAASPAKASTDQPPVASQSVDDLMQQLATIAGGNAPAINNSDTSATTGKTQTKPAKDDTSDGPSADDKAPTATPASTGAVVDALSLLNAAAQASAATVANAGQLNAAAVKPQVPAGAGANVSAATSAADTDASVDSDDMSLPSSAKAAVADIMSSGLKGAKDTADTDDSQTGTFRVASATGRSQAIDMSISKAADDSSQVDVKASSGSASGADTVTVLDSRRFPGLADGSNSALVANKLTGEGTLASALKAGSIAAANSNTSKVVNTLKIEMTPEKLGSVTATMRLSGDSLTVDLKVQSAEAYRQLSTDQSAMADSLRAQGYKVDQITVSYAPQTSADSNSQQNSQPGFQGQQQSGASQGQGSEAQSRRQNSGQQTNEQDGIRRAQTGGADDGAGGSAQRISSAGVYL